MSDISVRQIRDSIKSTISHKQRQFLLELHVKHGGYHCRLVRSKREAILLSIAHGERDELDMLVSHRDIGEGYMVHFLEEAMTDMTDAEKSACMLHELGHVVRGHFKDVETELQQEDPAVVLSRELEADAFAASQVGKSVMASALRKILKNRVWAMKQLDPSLDEEAQLQHDLQQDIMVRRFAALKE